MLLQIILSHVKMYVWAVMMFGSAQAASYRALSYHACYSMQSEMGMRRAMLWYSQSQVIVSLCNVKGRADPAMDKGYGLCRWNSITLIQMFYTILDSPRYPRLLCKPDKFDSWSMEDLQLEAMQGILGQLKWHYTLLIRHPNPTWWLSELLPDQF